MRLSPRLFSKSSSSRIHSLLLTMTTKEPRKILKANKNKMAVPYPAGNISLQVLGNSLFIFTDQTRYLFNAPEGTQRLASEHKLKLGKLEHVFLTSSRWERLGGLPGVALTVQDIGVEKAWVHGPPGLNHLFSTYTRRFLTLNNLELSTINTLNAASNYQDHVLEVEYINLDDGLNEDLSTPTLGEEEDTTDYYSNTRHQLAKVTATVTNGDDKRKKNVAVCYAIKFAKKDGALLIDKCIQKGVPPGPLLGRLKAGEDITLSDGSVVLAKDVRGPDCTGGIVLVLDCPTVSHLPSLVSHPLLEKYKSQEAAQVPNVITHFTPLDILQSDEYIKFLEEFPISSKHLIINEAMLKDSNEAVFRMQARLNLIDERLFPLFEEKKVKDELKLPVVNIIGQSGNKISLRPVPEAGVGNKFDEPALIINPPETYQNEMKMNEGFLRELELFKRQQPPQQSKPDEEFLLFLGTGSSIPNKTRNVSGIYFQLDKNNSMLFDCGEGTLGQLYRHSNYEEMLDSLKIIYISHLHADHHLGLFSFLKKKKNLIVIAPKQIRNWIDSFSRDFEKLEDYNLVPCDTLYKDVELDLSQFGVKSVLTCQARHCPNSFAVSVVNNSGKRVTYSGDTMPFFRVQDLGKGSDILIHEATMEDGLEKEAESKQHSTMSQAVEVGDKMGAKFIILTHFSQRYCKVPYMSKEIAERDNVGFAFDNMRVGLGEVGRLSGMGPVLKEGWGEEFEGMINREVKRVRRGDLMVEKAEELKLMASNVKS